MKRSDWLQRAESRLEAAGISTTRLDCLVLLEDILNTNRTQLLADPQIELTEVSRKKLDDLIAKRAQHIPLAQLRHKTEFYGRDFYIDERVLEPRPESETMIEILKTLPTIAPAIADVGSGSGAIGITAKLELPASRVTLLEIDAAALAVSRKNARLHNVVVQCTESDLLQSMTEHFDVLLCNLPYVPDGFTINTAALREPRVAIFGGPDGLDLYRRLFADLEHTKRPATYVLTESMPPQHSDLTNIAAAHGYRCERVDDFIQLFTNR